MSPRSPIRRQHSTLLVMPANNHNDFRRPGAGRRFDRAPCRKMVELNNSLAGSSRRCTVRHLSSWLVIIIMTLWRVSFSQTNWHIECHPGCAGHIGHLADEAKCKPLFFPEAALIRPEACQSNMPYLVAPSRGHRCSFDGSCIVQMVVCAV